MKKIFCVLLAVFLCFGSVALVVFASSDEYSYNGISAPYPPLEVLDEGFNTFFIMDTGDFFALICADSTFNFSNGDIFTPIGTVNYKTYVLFDGSWVFDSAYSESFDVSTIMPPIYDWASVADSNFVFPPPSPPLHVEVMEGTNGAVDGLLGFTFDSLGVLVPIGLVIMATFIGIRLIPRIIFKFL